MADEETKDGLMSFLINAASFGLMKAKNEADEKKKKDEKKAENEDIDKRKEMGDIGGFLKTKGLGDEDIKHVYKIMEKLSYDKSSTGTADNAKKECENGGAGSGDFGHAGRPGYIGGSDPKGSERRKKLKATKDYDKWEYGAHNEDDSKEKEEKYTGFEKEVDEEAENKKAKNEFEENKNKFYSGGNTEISGYVSRVDRLKAGEEYFNVGE